MRLRATRLTAVAHAVRIAVGGSPAWTPSSWFAASEQGVWYDPTDLTRYMDVSSSPELVTNGGFDGGTTGWTPTTATLTVVDGAMEVNVTSAWGYVRQLGIPGFTVGKAYLVSCNLRAGTVTTARIQQATAAFFGSTTSKSFVRITAVWVATATSLSLEIDSAGAVGTVYVDDVSVREIPLIGQATMYQDNAGTTPVTAVEQPVGLILDRRLGSGWVPLTLANWFKNSGDGVVSVSGNLITITGATTTTRVDLNARTVTRPGRTRLKVIYTNTGGATNPTAWAAGAPSSLTSGVSATLSTSSTNSTLDRVQIDSGSATFLIEDYSEFQGNHAFQATSTDRPTLSARVNGFVSTNDLRVTPWSAVNGLVSAFGASGEFKFVPNATAGTHGISQSVTPLSHSVITIEAKAAELQIIAFGEGVQTGNWASFNLSTGVALFGANRIKAVALADGWWRLSTKIFDAALSAAGNFGVRAMPNTATFSDNPHTFNWAGDGVSGILLRNPQVTQSNLAAVLFGASSYVAETYQRVTTATDYDSDPAKFPLYLAFDGSDDSMATSAVDFSATDEMTVVAGVSNLSTSTGIVCELSIAVASANGSFFFAVNDGSAKYEYLSRGTAGINANQAAMATSPTFSPPSKNVISVADDIAEDLSTIRVDGVLQGSATGDKGAGNFSNNQLFIGARSSNSLRFNGRIHQLIIRGKTSADIAQAESFVASKSGVTI